MKADAKAGSWSLRCIALEPRSVDLWNDCVPRQASFDTPNAMRHIMVRGINTSGIFKASVAKVCPGEEEVWLFDAGEEWEEWVRP